MISLSLSLLVLPSSIVVENFWFLVVISCSCINVIVILLTFTVRSKRSVCFQLIIILFLEIMQNNVYGTGAVRRPYGFDWVIFKLFSWPPKFECFRIIQDFFFF